MLDLGLFFKLIDVTEMGMTERHLETLLSICVEGVHVYCMCRRGEIRVVLGTGSAQIKVFIHRTVRTGALLTH